MLAITFYLGDNNGRTNRIKPTSSGLIRRRIADEVIMANLGTGLDVHDANAYQLVYQTVKEVDSRHRGEKLAPDQLDAEAIARIQRAAGQDKALAVASSAIVRVSRTLHDVVSARLAESTPTKPKRP